MQTVEDYYTEMKYQINVWLLGGKEEEFWNCFMIFFP